MTKELTAFLLAATATFAGAETIIHTGGFVTNPGIYPATYSYTVPQFDPALGTLLSVEATIAAEAFASIGADNESPGGANLSVRLAGIARLTFSSLVAEAAVTSLRQASVTGDTDAEPDFEGTDSVNLQNVRGEGSDAESLSSGFTFYIGTGTLPLTVFDEQRWTVLGLGDGEATVAGSRSNGDWQVIYTYAPAIPEPHTWAVGAMAGALLLGRRRRLPPAQDL